MPSKSVKNPNTYGPSVKDAKCFMFFGMSHSRHFRSHSYTGSFADNEREEMCDGHLAECRFHVRLDQNCNEPTNYRKTSKYQIS
jgi:hypothetical protein